MQVTFDPHPSIPVRFSETCMSCTNPSIRGEIAPPIRAYVDKGGILIDNSTVQFCWYKMCHTKNGCDQGASNFLQLWLCRCSLCVCIALFPSRRRNGLATSASSSCIQMWYHGMQLQYAFQQSSTRDTIFPAVRMGLSCLWKQLPAVSSTTEVK